MSAPVFIPGLPQLIEDFHKRIRRLEFAVPQAPGLGCECPGFEMNQLSPASSPIDWDAVVDPDAWLNVGDNTRLDVPTGGAGVYAVSLQWFIEVE